MSHKKTVINITEKDNLNKEEKDCCCKNKASKNEQKDCNCKNDDCQCEEKTCDCEHKDCKCETNKDLVEEYLNMAKRIQADFDNFRKRSSESVRQARLDGIVSALEVILPSLDVFKKAKQMIKDENDKKGIEMVESAIYSSLKTLNVEKINTKDEQFDPNLHYALSVMEDKTKPDNQILEEYQAGYKLGDKVIKYSQVIVNKLKEDK